MEDYSDEMERLMESMMKSSGIPLKYFDEFPFYGKPSKTEERKRKLEILNRNFIQRFFIKVKDIFSTIR
jgi:hypothetical protein